METKKYLVILSGGAKLIAKLAEKIKLQKLNLPYAYSQLGKEIYISGFLKDNFKELFSRIDFSLKDQENLVKNSIPTEGLIGIIKYAFDTANKKAVFKKKEYDRNKLFTHLGFLAYEKYREELRDGFSIDGVAKCIEKINLLDSEISTLNAPSKEKVFNPNNVAIGIIVLTILTISFISYKNLFEGTRRPNGEIYLTSKTESSFEINDAVDVRKDKITRKSEFPLSKPIDEFGENKITNQSKINNLKKNFQFKTFDPLVRPEVAGIDLEVKYKALVSKIQVGMSRDQVENVLGLPDDETENDLGEFNPLKSGQILTILTWNGDAPEKPSIILGFINNRLTQGGTPGYDIVKGFHGKLPNNMTSNEKMTAKKALKSLGFAVDE